MKGVAVLLGEGLDDIPRRSNVAREQSVTPCMSVDMPTTEKCGFAFVSEDVFFLKKKKKKSHV